MPSDSAILTSLLVGVAATLCTLVIHGFVVHAIVMGLRRNLMSGLLGLRIWVNMTFVMSATLLAFLGHLVEIAFWAVVLGLTGAVAGVGAALTVSAGNYTTLGSGIELPPQWKLLGPLEAVCGMLMFGVSTAFIFAVIQRLIQERFEDDKPFL